jgi:hypothetical protein
MENKHYYVPQPPESDKYTFLVDVIDEAIGSGIVSDFKKIDYNLDVFKIHPVESIFINKLSHVHEAEFIAPVGRFILITTFRKGDNNKAAMTFLDHSKTTFNTLKQVVSNIYKDEVLLKEFEDCYSKSFLTFSTEEDNSEISLSM